MNIQDEPAYQDYLSETTEEERDSYSFQDYLDDIQEQEDRGW